MKRTYSVYPKNKSITSNALFKLPLQTHSFSIEKNNPYFQNKKNEIKSKRIKKFIEEIKLTNQTQNTEESNNKKMNLYNYQKQLIEEKIKNKCYYDNIISLNKHIDELEFKLKNNVQNTDDNINDELIRLRQENKELKIFKEKVYSFSMKYDEVNNDIYNCLQSIEKLVELYNMDFSNQNIEYKNDNLKKISNNFKSIIKDLTNFLTIKQAEFNTLLSEKEKEIEKLKRDFNNINSDTYSIGIKSCRNLKNHNKLYNYTCLNKSNRIQRLNKSFRSCNICKTNEFDFGNKNKKKLDFSSTFQNF